MDLAVGEYISYNRGGLIPRKIGLTYPLIAFSSIILPCINQRFQEFNGLRVEVQIRSKLQHFWATAIETVDFFTRQAIKSSEGHPDWVDFFKLVSSAFAKM